MIDNVNVVLCRLCSTDGSMIIDKQIFLRDRSSESPENWRRGFSMMLITITVEFLQNDRSDIESPFIWSQQNLHRGLLVTNIEEFCLYPFPLIDRYRAFDGIFIVYHTLFIVSKRLCDAHMSMTMEACLRACVCKSDANDSIWEF